MPLLGGEARQLTDVARGASGMEWSPDGKRIAFESDRGSPDAHYAVFIVNRNGSGLMQVTDYALNASHPVWSRDGKHMVVMAGDPAKKISTVDMIDLP